MSNISCTNLAHPVATTGPVLTGRSTEEVEYRDLICATCGKSQGIKRIRLAQRPPLSARYYACCGTEFQGRTTTEHSEAHVRYHNQQFDMGHRDIRLAVVKGGDTPLVSQRRWTTSGSEYVATWMPRAGRYAQVVCVRGVFAGRSWTVDTEEVRDLVWPGHSPALYRDGSLVLETTCVVKVDQTLELF